jgi:hypothetical protein
MAACTRFIRIISFTCTFSTLISDLGVGSSPVFVCLVRLFRSSRFLAVSRENRLLRPHKNLKTRVVVL